MKDGGGHVVPLATVATERFECGEGLTEKIDGRLERMAMANFPDTFGAELFITKVASFGEAIAAEEDGVAGLQLQTQFVIRDTGKQAGGNSSNFQDVAFVVAKEKRTGHARAGNDHLASGGIEERVLQRSVAAGNATKREAFVEQGQNAAGRRAGFLNAAKSADGEGGIESSGKTFAGNVAEVETDGSVGKGEIVEVIAADFREGLEFVRDDDAEFTERMPGEHSALDDACFLEFLLA